MSENNLGIVYVFTNPAMSGLVKIGITTREEVDDRLRELFNTSVPVPFECEFACKVAECKMVEQALHLAFSPNRINPLREFFRIDPEQAIAILKLVSIEDVTPDVVREYEKGLDPQDAESGKKLKQQRRPPLNFTEMEIPLGSTLKYVEGNIEVTVSSSRKVRYNLEEMSLTRATRMILGVDYDVQPTRHWYFNGKCLADIYEDTYVSIADNA